MQKSTLHQIEKLKKVKKSLFMLFLIKLWFLSTGFMVGTFFKEAKAFKETPPQDLVTVGVTHVITGDDAKNNKIFWQNTYRVVDALPQHGGYLGHKVRKKIWGNEAWTMTVWRDENSLNAFVRGDVHGQAMKNGLAAVKKARFVRFAVARDKMPMAWSEIEKIMDEKGRDLY